MPRLDHNGPEGKGAGTGRGLGNCPKLTSDIKQIGEPGIGMGKRRHSQNPLGVGYRRRTKYDQTTN